MAGKTRLVAFSCIAFRIREYVGSWYFPGFGAQYYPYSLTPHALHLLLPSDAQGSLPMVWLLPYRMGFPPICVSCPCWAHHGFRLFADITDYSDYTHNPLILAVNVQYKELLEFVDCCWQNEKAKGALFQNHFQKYFPPGYIDRDPGKAREIYKSLLHIPQSDMIRTDLPPICTYVMYQFIVEYGPFTRLSKACWYTEELEKYMKAMPQRSESLVNQKDVTQWFKDIRTWCEDFEISYDSDYVCLESIEAFGTLYLQNDEQSRKRFSQLGIDIEELADLLPFDLRCQVLKKFEAQKRFIPVDEEIVHKAIISASEKLAASPADSSNLGEDALNRKCFLQDLFGENCKTFLEVVATPFWRKLQRIHCGRGERAGYLQEMPCPPPDSEL